MSDNPTADATPVDADAQPQNGTPNAAPAADTSSVDTLPEWASKELKALRKENETRRKAEKQRQEAEMSEAQKLQARLEELTGAHSTALQELRSLKAQGIARDAGALYPDLVADKLSDEALSGDKAARDKEIDRLRKQYPGLFRTTSADGGARGEAPAGDMNMMLRRAAGRTS